MPEYTTIGVDLEDELAYVYRNMSSGQTPLVANTLDTRAGPLPPHQGANGGVTRTVRVHAIIDGCIVTFIVDNQTAISVFVYPQLPSSDSVGIWAFGGAEQADTYIPVQASVRAWQLASVY